MREGGSMSKVKKEFAMEWMPDHMFLDHVRALEKAAQPKQKGLTALDRAQIAQHEGMRRRYMLREQYR